MSKILYAAGYRKQSQLSAVYLKEIKNKQKRKHINAKAKMNSHIALVSYGKSYTSEGVNKAFQQAFKAFHCLFILHIIAAVALETQLSEHGFFLFAHMYAFESAVYVVIAQQVEH